MTDRKVDADLHYQQAMGALSDAHFGNYLHAPYNVEAGFRLHLAQVSSIREQTVELRRIAAALERREQGDETTPMVCVNGEADCEQLEAEGWRYIGYGHVCSQTGHIYQRPRNVPKDAEGG